MNKRIKIWLSFICLLSIWLLHGCRPDECLEGAGSESKQRVETGFFKELNIIGIFEVFLVQDTTCFLMMEGGENMLKHTNADNSDSVLWLDNSNSCYFLKDYQQIKVYVHFSDISAIHLRQACKLRTSKPITNIFVLTVEEQVADVDIELNNEHFFFYNHQTSGGKYIFRGWCTNCSLMSFYTGQIDASNLNTKTMNIENHSVTNCYVKAEETVHASIFNNGDIFVYGNPEVFIDSIQGSGKVIKVD